MFDIISTNFEDNFDKMFENLFSPRSLSGLFPTLPSFRDIKFPVNISTTKAGNQIIELAVCGKSKEDIEVSWEPMKNGCYCLFIKVGKKDVEKTEDTEPIELPLEPGVRYAIESDEYEVRKLKKSIQDIKLIISSEYNMEKLYSKVKDGLLTIVIPKADKKQVERKIVEIH